MTSLKMKFVGRYRERLAMMRALGYMDHIMVRLKQVKSVNGGDEGLVRKDAEGKTSDTV